MDSNWIKSHTYIIGDGTLACKFIKSWYGHCDNGSGSAYFSNTHIYLREGEIKKSNLNYLKNDRRNSI